jgi:hypothetical protein
MSLPPCVRTLPALGLALAALSSPAALAQEPVGRRWGIELSVPVSYAYGHTTYRIDGTYAGGGGLNRIQSELEFPISTGLVGGRARLAREREAGRGGPAFELSGQLAVASQETAKMKDSDWLEGPLEDPSGNPGKDIYSESDAKLSGGVIEGRFAWEMDTAARGVVVAPMFGLLYQRFEYVVSDGQQVGYGGFTGETTSLPGRVLDYEIAYLLPYVGGRAAMSRGAITADAELWFSPSADASDVDDHLLRDLRLSTDASGTAWSGSLRARLAVGSRGAFEAHASLLRVRATGLQHQVFYGGPLAGQEGRIPSTITSSRATFGLAYVHSL